MSETPRYATLRDYARVLGERRVLITAMALLFGGVAFGYSAAQDPAYSAEVSVSFHEANQDLNLIGSPAVPTSTPEQRAAVNAALLTRRAVAERVRDALDSALTAEQLQGRVSAKAEARTNLVVVSVRDQSASFAARLANEFGKQVAAEARDRERRQISNALASLRRERSSVSRGARGDLSRALLEERINRLETLRALAEPAEVARAAEVPTSPVSPRPLRNTVLGIIFGLTLGVLFAFMRDSLDLRLKSSKEIEQEYGLPRLGQLSEDALGHTGFVENGRVTMDLVDLEAAHILRTNLEFVDVDRPLRSIVVTSALPEEGKSTVAAALAWAYAFAGKRTLLVECDLRAPVLAERLALEPTPGLTEYLVGRASPRDILQPRDPRGPDEQEATAEGAATLPEGNPLVCITAGSPVPNPAEVLASQRFRAFLGQVTSAYEMVILDSSPILSVVDTRELVPFVDGVLVCARSFRTTREQAEATREAFEHVHVKPTGLVVTGVKPGEESSYGYYYAYFQPSSGSG